MNVVLSVRIIRLVRIFDGVRSLQMALNDSWVLENAGVRTFPSKPTLLYTIQLYAVPRRLFSDPKTRDLE